MMSTVDGVDTECYLLDLVVVGQVPSRLRSTVSRHKSAYTRTTHQPLRIFLSNATESELQQQQQVMMH